ncbi:lactate racemase domain-containing protein [Natronolimnohabitans sp. A-GB9]|uniref:lactate racemase domain-containing protein n=1 Tax=Natronolimnohabitans sp. A-GB9 TaxID=3069757 RepID=UPI0027B3865C|nr:lactate racemase domain-containing protein [Natronolimnohabitans sp. A-GB9]MDQ2049477.1 lactate racemase domain-containing protein [Natronolimnohabitans sp. A-GB9]
MEIPLGAGTIDPAVPDCPTTVADPPGGEPVDVREAAQRALEDPLGAPLSTRVDPDDDVTIVVTDVTRKAPDDILLDVLLERLAACGIEREQVTVVIGLGLHRPMTDDEIEAMLGPHADLAANHDPESVVVVGTVADGEVPVEIGEPVADADTVLSTGVVEPHQYAGFSGGAKTVVIGAGGESLIRYTHGPEMLAREGVRLGRVEGNPFRETLDAAGDLAGLDFSVNLTHGPAGVLGVRAGDGRRVVRELAAIARDALSVPIDREFDAVVCGVGAPKDANLYQATRGATYVALGDRNPLREGGRLVVPAALPEGVGDGTGEQRFYRRLSGANDAETLYRAMREGYEPGAQRAFVVARVLREHDLYITNSEAPTVVEDCLMHAEADVADALESGSEVLVVPDALNTLLVDPDT